MIPARSSRLNDPSPEEPRVDRSGFSAFGRALFFCCFLGPDRPGLPFLSLSWGALNAQPLHFVESVGGQCVPAKTAQLRSDDRQSTNTEGRGGEGGGWQS